MRYPRATILAAATLLGCHSPAAPPPGVSVAATLSSSAAVVGQPLAAEVTITNASAHEYLVPGSAGRCIGFLDVRDSRGVSVLYGDPRICDAAAARHRLAAFGALSDRLPITRLPAGDYWVRAGIAVVDHGQLWSAFHSLSVRGR
jgi:hypothetical protein